MLNVLGCDSFVANLSLLFNINDTRLQSVQVVVTAVKQENRPSVTQSISLFVHLFVHSFKFSVFFLIPVNVIRSLFDLLSSFLLFVPVCCIRTSSFIG